MTPEEADGKVIPLGERLRAHRAERGLSQAQAARELDVARTAYRLWEMEAAKPSPDRWRLIARWLGVSISTMLLGENLIDEGDAEAADLIAGRAAEAADPAWDEIVAAMQTGGVAPAAGVFRKEMTADSSAPAIARRALVVTATGADDDVIERAELLTSELVTNAVERSNGGSIWLAITQQPEVLRVEVLDGGTLNADRPRDQRASWSLALISELASRFGAGREGELNVSWFETDLPA